MLCLLTSPAYGYVQTYNTVDAHPGDVVYAWFTQPDPDWNVTEFPAILPAGWEAFQPYKFNNSRGYQWCWGIRIPEDEDPGDYTIEKDGDDDAEGAADNFTVTVTAAPTPRPVKYISKALLSRMQYFLDIGYDLDVGPCNWDSEETITVPDGATIKGVPGATIFYCNNPESTGGFGDFNQIFILEGSAKFDGITFDCKDALRITPVFVTVASMDFDTDHIREFRNCTFRHGKATELYGPVLLDNCDFNQGGMSGFLPVNSVVRFCRFKDPAFYTTEHSLIVNGGTLVASCFFENTTRGIVCQAGDASGMMYIDNQFHHIRNGEQNANECIFFEAGTLSEIEVEDGMHDVVILDCGMHDCAGPAIFIGGSGMHDFFIAGIEAYTDHYGVYIAAHSTWHIEDINFENFSTTGGFYGVGHISGSLSNFCFIEKQQLRGNQIGPFNSAGYIPTKNANFPFDFDATATSDNDFSFTNTFFINYNRTIDTISSLGFTPTP